MFFVCSVERSREVFECFSCRWWLVSFGRAHRFVCMFFSSLSSLSRRAWWRVPFPWTMGEENGADRLKNGRPGRKCKDRWGLTFLHERSLHFRFESVKKWPPWTEV